MGLGTRACLRPARRQSVQSRVVGLRRSHGPLHSQVRGECFKFKLELLFGCSTRVTVKCCAVLCSPAEEVHRRTDQRGRVRVARGPVPVSGELRSCRFGHWHTHCQCTKRFTNLSCQCAGLERRHEAPGKLGRRGWVPSTRASTPMAGYAREAH